MIVGIAGAAGSGKDTIAKALMKDMGYSKISFAGKLKHVLCDIFGWQYSDWDSLEWKETPNEACYGRTPREIAQTFGTDWGRNTVHPDIWVDAAMRTCMAEQKAFGIKHVFTDVRFPNEARAIRNAGGIILFVTCVDRPTGTTSNDHESEAWLPWLFTFADCDIKAPFGYIEELQAAGKNVVQNYLDGKAPRFAQHSDSTQTALLDLEKQIAEELKAKTQ